MNDNNKNNNNDNIVLLFQKLDAKIEKISTDIYHELDKVQTKLFFKLASLMITCIGIASVLMMWIFDYKFDFTNERHQSNIEKLESAVFVPQHDIILKAILELKEQIENKE